MNEINTLIDLLHRAAIVYHGRVALSEREGLRNRSWTYGDLSNAVAAFAGHLRYNLKLRQGDRIVICAPNSCHLVATHFGTMSAGLIPILMDVGSSESFVKNVIRKTEAAAVVSNNEAMKSDDVLFIDIAKVNFNQGQSFVGPYPNADDIAELVFTSGTTGDPKGVVLSHRNIVANVKAAVAIVRPDIPLRLLSFLPLSHMLEQTAGLYLPLNNGGSVHYLMSPQPPSILRELRRQKSSGMVVVPRLLQMMFHAIEGNVQQHRHLSGWSKLRELALWLPVDARRKIFPSTHKILGGQLRFVMCGGASLSRKDALAWESLGIRVIEGYGATECSPVISSNTFDSRHLGTVGRPLPGVQVSFSQDDEVLVRGDSVFKNYWRDAKSTEGAFTPDGWFRTGDVATQDEAGVIRMLARLGDRIVLQSGLKVYPKDVEAQLCKEPVVKDCIVLAMAADDGHDQVHAVIRPQPNEPVTAEDIQSSVWSANQRLAPHQRVMGFSVWTQGDFPRTNLGKVRHKDVHAALTSQRLATATRWDSSQSHIDENLGSLSRVLQKLVKTTTKPITASSDLGLDLGLDSLGRLELVAQIEQELGVELDERKLSSVNTVGELADLARLGSTATVSTNYSEWPLGQLVNSARAVLQSAIVFPLHRLICRPFCVESDIGDNAQTQPVLLVANHCSHIDTISILRALPTRQRTRLAIAAAQDYFYKNRISGWVTSLLLNTFPFSRLGNVRASLDRCGELVDKGWSILIFPEGTRSPDGRLMSFKSGVGLLAKGLRVPVIPIAVTGGYEILPKGSSWPRRGPVAVRIGMPMVPDPNAIPDELADQLHDTVARLLVSSRAIMKGI